MRANALQAARAGPRAVTWHTAFMTAKTSAERQRAFRERKKAEQSDEVRGIFAPKHLHDAIKEQIRKFLDKQKNA